MNLQRLAPLLCVLLLGKLQASPAPNLIKPACYEHTQSLLEKNEVVYSLLQHSYGADNPFLGMHVIIELTSELQQTVARSAFTKQSTDDVAHTQFLKEALGKIDIHLSALLANFIYDQDRYASLTKLLAAIKEAKEYIDLNLPTQVEKSHTYRRASRHQKRFLATTAITAFFAGNVIKKVFLGVFGVVAGVILYKALTKKQRSLRKDLRDSRNEYIAAVESLKNLILENYNFWGIGGKRRVRQRSLNTFQRLLDKYPVDGIVATDLNKSQWRLQKGLFNSGNG